MICQELLETDLDFKIVFKGATMEELFELEKFDSYKEDNREEVKKQKVGYRIPILLVPIAMAASLPLG